MKTICIVGTVGLPANYGGFETLAENLVRHHDTNGLGSQLVVYCSGKSYPERRARYIGAELRYIELNANGVASILYDIVSMLSAVAKGCDTILVLGVSGAIALPWLRWFTRTRIVTNIDGLEWKREKWSASARWFLRFSEKLAVRFSHTVIADNKGIADHVNQAYGKGCQVIAYGGDHAVAVTASRCEHAGLPEKFALALCRIEPENNVAMILDAFGPLVDQSLVFVGNWQSSAFGRELRARHAANAHLHLLDPIYDVALLRDLRNRATVYIHGHSAGGTNPSLVEMMHFGVPIIAFDCIYNQYSTEGKALYFSTASELARLNSTLDAQKSAAIGEAMAEIARNRYSWQAIGTAYFELL